MCRVTHPEAPEQAPVQRWFRRSPLYRFAVVFALTMLLPPAGCRQQAELPPSTVAAEQLEPADETNVQSLPAVIITVESTVPAVVNKPDHDRPADAARRRLPDNRPKFNESQLRDAGISVYRSRRLVLLSDAPAEQIDRLPALADQLFEHLEATFGQLPESADGSEFQVTGCLIDAQERFASAGLMPEMELVIRHGRHLDYRFWMYNPPSDYYRRHLLLHEFVHCFMTCEYGMQDIPPLWYTEGIAEYFATHAISNNLNEPARFGVLPEELQSFHGWGRISEIQRAFRLEPSAEPRDAGFTALQTVLDPPTRSFQQDSQYAHAWALYWVLQQHPHYQPVFEPMRQIRNRDQFAEFVAGIPPELWQRLEVDWLLILDSITPGFDTERSFPVHVESPERTNVVQAASGWQDSGQRFDAGESVTITASGRFTVSQTPIPWISEPQGITIEYHRGRPLGELTAILIAADGSMATQRIPVGVGTRLTVPYDAELWLQLNDSAASRSDNDGHVSVRISRDL